MIQADKKKKMILISIPLVIGDTEVFGWIGGDFMAGTLNLGPIPPPPSHNPHTVILSVQRGTGIRNLSATSSGCRRTPNTPHRRITGHYPALNQTAQDSPSGCSDCQQITGASSEGLELLRFEQAALGWK